MYDVHSWVSLSLYWSGDVSCVQVTNVDREVFEYCSGEKVKYLKKHFNKKDLMQHINGEEKDI